MVDSTILGDLCLGEDSLMVSVERVPFTIDRASKVGLCSVMPLFLSFAVFEGSFVCFILSSSPFSRRVIDLTYSCYWVIKHCSSVNRV
jgi:hypothetical protein